MLAPPAVATGRAGWSGVPLYAPGGQMRPSLTSFSSRPYSGNQDSSKTDSGESGAVLYGPANGCSLRDYSTGSSYTLRSARRLPDWLGRLEATI
jgi:hypothetical protein